jgi:hypothetical protein
MKERLGFIRFFTILAVVLSTASAMAQTTGPQTVCISTQNYNVIPGNTGNTFTWSVSPGTSGVDWSISYNNPYDVNIVWLKPEIYTVRLTEKDIATNCETIVSVVVTVNGLPANYSVSGGGAYCTGGSGVTISLSGSESGVTYTLWKDGSATAISQTGTGAGLTFTGVTAAGNYTVVATNASSCSATMTGNATVSVIALPTVYNVTGGGSYCTGGAGVSITLSNSQTGFNYELLLGGVPTGTILAGTTGNSLTFTDVKTAGTYTIKATNASSCEALMSGSVTITINPLPATSQIRHN